MSTPAPPEAETIDVDVAIVGAGGAGLALAMALDARGAAARGLRIAVLDPTHRSEADRTWCYWEHPDDPVGGPAVAALAHRRWSSMEVGDRAGVRVRHDLAPLRYVMVRSQDFYRAADAALARLGAVRLPVAVDSITPRSEGVRVNPALTHDRGAVYARWVIDSRPAAPVRAARTAWLQHFRGWTVHLPGAHLDPATATFMDFSTPQPARGVSFAYCLPLGDDRALVEYTEFSPHLLEPAAYDAALAGYLRARWSLEPSDVAVEHVEHGVIPMTDAVYARRAGPRVMRVGTAGGAVRPATGYAFAAMQRQAGAMAQALVDGRDPIPPAPYPGRHRWMDAVLLRALDRGLTPGPELFVRLFARNPTPRVLRFLDGRTTPAQELAVMATCPPVPMAGAAAADALVRLRNRVSTASSIG